ncbi:hypothetical protein [Acidisarcina polymorpha]|uniref:hypothetical protein n=1 Tax=Acidisarcina polymorpha TaxID=2211140 RepID=UPI000DEED30A|nr:hypothetical protein [Acidisarcina polymorpha]
MLYQLSYASPIAHKLREPVGALKRRRTMATNSKVSIVDARSQSSTGLPVQSVRALKNPVATLLPFAQRAAPHPGVTRLESRLAPPTESRRPATDCSSHPSPVIASSPIDPGT